MTNPPKTLTLDLGTRTGWALMEHGSILQSGTLLLASPDELEMQRQEGKERTLDVRYTRLLKFLLHQVQENGVSRIIFEDVLFSSTQMQSQLWASFRTAIWTVAVLYSVESCGVPVNILKAFATGTGNAKKPEMAKALATIMPQYQLDPVQEHVSDASGRVLDDNEVDALWLARYVQEVDKGGQSFSSVFQRKANAKQELRRQRALRRKKAQELKKAALLAEKNRKKAIQRAIRGMGKCCGVVRRPEPGLIARCPRCGNAKKFHLPVETPIEENQSVGE